MRVYVRTAMLDGPDTYVVGVFWCQAFGYEWETPIEVTYEHVSITLVHSDPTMPVLWITQGDTRPNGLGIAVPGGSLEAEASRLVSLGARTIRTFESGMVMADPGGNEFTLISTAAE